MRFWSFYSCFSQFGFNMNSLLQEIPFQHVWNSTQTHLHCSFTLERTDRLTSNVNFKVLACQKGCQNHRQIFRVNAELRPESSLSSLVREFIASNSSFANLPYVSKILMEFVSCRYLLVPRSANVGQWRVAAAADPVSPPATHLLG